MDKPKLSALEEFWETLPFAPGDYQKPIYNRDYALLQALIRIRDKRMGKTIETPHFDVNVAMGKNKVFREAMNMIMKEKAKVVR